MRVEIFDVEHGFCALVTGRGGERILVDCGHNSTTGWRPSTYLRKEPLDLLIILNYDQDHLSDFCGVQSQIGFRMLAANFSVSPVALFSLKRQQGPLTSEMRALVNELSAIGPVSPFQLPSIRWWSFCIPFPSFGPADTNKHSLVVFMEADGISIVFPGDLSAEGWRELLSQPLFLACLKRVNIFVASHHGREDGFCKEVFDFCSPDVVIISDGPIQYDTQRSTVYSQYAKGVMIEGDTYYTLTTRRYGMLTIESSGFGFTVNVSKGITKAHAPMLRGLLSLAKPSSIPPAPGLLGLSPTAQALRPHNSPTRMPGFLDLVPPHQGLSLTDFLKPPSQLPRPPASPFSPPRENSPLANLLSELLKYRNKP